MTNLDEYKIDYYNCSVRCRIHSYTRNKINTYIKQHQQNGAIIPFIGVFENAVRRKKITKLIL